MKPNSCAECPYKGQKIVESEGDPESCKYIFLGEAPAYDEIRKGRPFVGQTGRLFMKFLNAVGIEREECYFINAVQCKLPRDKKGLGQAIKSCRGRLLAELSAINTGAVMAIMGGTARDALYPGERGGIMAAKGWRKWEGRDALVMAHPAFYLYNPNYAPMLMRDCIRVSRGRQDPPKVEYTLLDTLEKLRNFVDRMLSGEIECGKYLAFDLETDQVDFMRDRILCMSISTVTSADRSVGQAWIVPDSLLYEDGNEWVTTGADKKFWKSFLNDRRYQEASYLHPRKEVAAELQRLLDEGDQVWVGHNAKFDWRFLIWQLGIEPPGAERMGDTIVMHYTLDERKGGHSLKPLADDYYDVGDYEAELFNYVAKKSARYSQIPRRVLYRYNAMDTELTLRFAYDFESELRKQGLFERPYLYPMMFAYPMLLHAEITGVYVDWDELERIEFDEIEPELARSKAKLRRLSGDQELNPLSSVKVNDILYDQFNFPIIEVRTRAAGKRLKKRSSQKAVMLGWDQMWEQGRLDVTQDAYDFMKELWHYRHVRKMLGSYVRKWRKYRGLDNRVHTSYQLRGTVTGRLSSKDPPLQTIPSKVSDKWGPLIANVHQPKPGYKLLYADYSQAELMAAACLSGDEFMLNAFKAEDADYHSEVARAAYGDDFSRDDRQACKRVTFGWLYGGNVEEIALKALQFQGETAKHFATEWDKRFKGVIEWRHRQEEKMREQGYVESEYGRRRRYMLLSDKNYGKAMRVATNAPIQSVVSDLTLLSAARMYYAYEEDPEVNVILLIHDSLIMEVKEDRIEEVKEKMHETMIGQAEEVFPQVRFIADVKIGERLGDLT